MAYADKSELRAAVRSWLAQDNVTVLPDSVIDDAIGFVESDLNFGTFGPQNKAFRVLNMQLVKTTLIQNDGEEYVSLPEDFITMRYVYVKTSSAKQTLDYATPEDFINSLVNSGDTLIYSISNGEIRVKPTLSANDQVEMGYYGEVPALVANTDSNWLLSINPQIYLYGTLSHVMTDDVLGNQAKMANAVAGYERAVLGMIKSDMRRQTGEGPLTYGMHEAVA